MDFFFLSSFLSLFSFVSFDVIIKCFSKMHHFEKLKKIILRHNGLDHFSMLEHLKRLVRVLWELSDFLFFSFLFCLLVC